MWEGSVQAKESLIFFVRMFGGRGVLTCNEAYKF
jgi:hypothetical protein